MPLPYRLWLVAGGISPWLPWFIALPSPAQIIPDVTLGTEASLVSPGVEVRGDIADLLEGGAVRGSNLFHSFLEFNIDEGQRVYFGQPNGIINIFGRVTGGNGSNVMGTLGVDGLANLMLINPNGIMFGPNAQLDVTGSLTASTAESIVFDDGQAFSAIAPEAPPILRLNVTPGLQYGNQPTTLVNQGNLRTRQNLTLGAQTLNIAGQLEAGRDIILQGQERRLSEGQYTVGGYFFTQDLSGAGIDLIIPHENVIVASGDVRFEENYVGPSLYILAGGKVSQAEGVENIEITGTAGSSLTQSISNGTGGTQTVTVMANNQPTLDIRSDSFWRNLIIDFPENSTEILVNTLINESTNEGIHLDNITNRGGSISLVAETNIETGNLDTSLTNSRFLREDGGQISLIAGNRISAENLNSSSTEIFTLSNGGVITLISGGNISVANLDSDALNGVGGSITLASRDGISGENLDSSGISGGAIILVSGDNISLGSLDSSASSGDISNGSGGAISLTAEGNISTENLFSRATFLLFLDDKKTGNGGPIALFSGGDISTADIDSSSLVIFAGVNPETGDGGSIDFVAEQDIKVRAINSSSSLLMLFSSSDFDGKNGRGGDVNLVAREGSILFSPNLVDSSLTQTEISTFSVYFPYSLSPGESQTGQGGSVYLQANSVINNLEILTTSSSADSGKISIFGSDDLELTNLTFLTSKTVDLTGRIPLVMNAIIPVGTQGKPGDIMISGNGDLAFINTTFLSTTNSIEPAGSILIASSDQITFSNSNIFSETENIGSAGSINISSPQISIVQESRISTSTLANGQAGDVLFYAEILTLADRSKIVASTAGAGNGGNITIRATETILRNGSEIAVTSTGQGQGGNIVLEGNRLTFDNSRMVAETASSDGGNISLTLGNLLLMRNGNLISTTAGTAQSGGNGGNITISAPFIIAIPNENSDIAADAFAGSGGNVNITARGIFGIEPRPQRTPLSDITASSELGVSGVVTLNALDTGFIENSLSNLEDTVVDTTALTAGSCIARTDESLGSFVVTGSGGLPQRPGDSGISTYPTGTVRAAAEPSANQVLQEPDGVYQLPDGRLVLSRACE